MCNLKFFCRYLATGETFTSLHYQFRLGISTIQAIILDTCKAIWQALVAEVLPDPTPQMWLHSAEQFAKRWNLPNCIGALDGKHVQLIKPSNTGSLFYNYKGTFSMVLMGIVNAEYKFLCVDIGAYGSQGDGGVWRLSEMGCKFNSGAMNVPLGRRIEGFMEEGPIPFYIAADDAFPLQPDILRPFSGKDKVDKERAHQHNIAHQVDGAPRRPMRRELSTRQCVYNYRLSRGRRIVENAFGILVHRFQVLLNPMKLRKPNHAETVILACVSLHNFLTKEVVSVAAVMARLRQAHRETKCPKRECEEEELQDSRTLLGLHSLPGQRFKDEAHRIRDLMADYFMGPGAVEWQWEQAGVPVVVSLQTLLHAETVIFKSLSTCYDLYTL